MEFSNNQKRIVLLVLLGLLAPFLYLFGFVHPVADDLGFAYQAQQAQLWEILVNFYHKTNGLYSGNFIMLLFPFSLTDLLQYRLFLVINFLFFGVAIFYLIHVVFSGLTLLDKSIVSLLFLLTVLSSTTDLSEAFYWQTSVVYYQLSLTLMLFYLGFLVQYFQRKFILNKVIHQLILILMLVFIIGIKESIALIMGFVSALLFYYSYFKFKEGKLFFLVQLIVALSCIAVVAFAPGNDYRMANYSNTKNFSYSILYTIMQMGRFTLKWIIAFSGILFVFVLAELHQKATPVLKKLDWKIALIIFLGILFLCIFPAYWVTGILGQHRTLNIASLFFVLFLLTLTINQGAYFAKYVQFNFAKKLGVFCLVFLLAGNGGMVVSDIFSGSIKNYDKQLSERAELIQQTQSTAELPLLVNAPKSLFVVDIQQDTTHWINQAYLLEIK
ncbi:MAG: DUF6056 family protein [Flavobacteriales bacterium]